MTIIKFLTAIVWLALVAFLVFIAITKPSKAHDMYGYIPYNPHSHSRRSTDYLNGRNFNEEMQNRQEQHELQQKMDRMRSEYLHR